MHLCESLVQNRSKAQTSQCELPVNDLDFFLVIDLIDLIAILPTNNQLLNPTLDRRSAETERLLARWGRLHAVRSVLSAMALLLFLYLAIFKEPL
ncbi:MAG: DUF1772 domain-containing protein [Candidatus Sulfotelmatobacter sp.]